VSTHLNDDELIARLYGVGENRHECVECARRLRALEQQRSNLAAPVEAPADFLAAQRRRIYARVGEKPRRSALGWVPAMAAALCIAAGVFMYHDRPAAHPVRHSAFVAPAHAPAHDAAHEPTADAQLFSDVYAMEQSVEPRAAAPIHELIEDN
jgi:hypothetical protein